MKVAGGFRTARSCDRILRPNSTEVTTAVELYVFQWFQLSFAILSQTVSEQLALTLNKSHNSTKTNKKQGSGYNVSNIPPHLILTVVND